MDTLTSMRVFAAVVEAGSFAAAAERLGLSRAMVSKHVAQLEQHLGTRLLHRTTRRLGLTAVGASYHERCIQILADLAEAEASAAQQTLTPRGTLRLAMPVSFGVRHLGPLIARYLERHPDVGLDAVLSDRQVDLVEEGLDLAIRISHSPEPGLVARRLANARVVLCAAPAYLERHGTPTHPDQLRQHNCALYVYSSAGSEWTLQGPDGSHRVKVGGQFRANNGDLLRQLAIEGLALLRQPHFLVGDDLRAGRLVELLPDWRIEPLGIYAVYPSRKLLSAKVRSFVDFMAEELPGWLGR